MTKMLSFPTGLVPLLWALAFVLVAGCSESAPNEAGAKPSRRQPVVTGVVEYQSESTFVEAVGTSRARRSIALQPAVTGEVVAVNFVAGERVEKGETLVRLDDRDEQLAVELAQVELDEAERILDRYRRTAQSGGVTQSVLDTARSEVERARIALKRAQVELDYHTIKAPFSGYIGISDIDPGAWIAPDTDIATLDDRSTLLVRFQLPEILLGELQKGQRIQLSTWSDRFSLAEGEVVDIGSRVDETRRTFVLRAEVNNENDVLRPGMSFRIQLTLNGNRYPRVPEMALQWGGEGSYVWVVEEGKAKRVTANIVQRREGGVLVDADLPEGTHVVVEGVHAMREGMTVRPLNAELETAKSEDEL